MSSDDCPSPNSVAMKKILILTANPKNTDRLSLDEEVKLIAESLTRAKFRDRFQVVVKLAVGTKELRQSLLDHRPQIVHFSGHGAGEHGLVLQNNAGQMQLVTTDSLAGLFDSFEGGNIECVLLNACYSEIQAIAIHQVVDCVIGMNQPIGDKSAIQFAEGFYDALGSGSPYDEAYKVGCNAIALEGSTEYSTPVLKYRKRPTPELSGNKTASQPLLPEKPPPVEPSGGMIMTINGGTISGQAGQAGRDLTQTQSQNQEEPINRLSTAEVVELITQIESLLRRSVLPEDQKGKAVNCLRVAKEEASGQKPDKEFAAQNLKRATKFLKEANGAVDAGQSLWTEVAPLFGQLSPWLGVASNFFGL
jgi:hypothetical protein